MLGKLFKNEFAKTWKIAVLSYVCSVVMSILVTVLLRIESGIGNNAAIDSTGTRIFEAIISVIAIVGAISIVFIPGLLFIYLCVHFFKTMYSSQGYLTHTLPASPVASFNVKLLVSSIWMLAGIVLMTLTLIIIGFICSGASLSELFSAELRELIKEGLEVANTELMSTIGITIGGILRIFIFSVVLGVIGAFLFIFTALTIGQLSNNHKIGLAIGAGIGINFAEKILGGILTIVISAKMFFAQTDISSGYNEAYLDYSGFFGKIIWLSFGLAIAICVIEYVIDVLIIRKHINLE